MPAYDYRCLACETRFEVVRPMGAADDVRCPECGGEARRVFAPVGLAFKGSGFHNTDYKPSEPPEVCPATQGGVCESGGA